MKELTMTILAVLLAILIKGIVWGGAIYIAYRVVKALIGF